MQKIVKPAFTSFSSSEKIKKILIPMAEIALICVWALWIGRAYLDLNPDIVPAGSEYIMSLQNNFNWQMLAQCGPCFFWNGFTNGGVPSFIDTHGSWLHPISSLPTLLLGVLNGGKITFILSILMAGLAQWWLGRVLKIGIVPRLWGALLVVAGGHLSGRMETASLSLVVSTAACSLAIPAFLQLALFHNRKNAIVLGIILGLAALSGQGYLQIGLMAAMVPSIIYLLMGKKADENPLKLLWKEYALAGLLAFMIAGVLFVPLVMNASLMGKDTDPGFTTAQPLLYSVLNLIIDDVPFYHNDSLGKMPFPYLYINFIGWIPLAFAVVAILTVRAEHRRLMISFGIALAMIYLVSSAILYRWIALLPWEGLRTFMAGLRNPSVTQGLAIPFVAALSSMGLEKLINNEDIHLNISLAKASRALGQIMVPLKKLALLLAMLIALNSLAKFSQVWVYTYYENGESMRKIIQELKTPDAQWVQPVFGEYYWLPLAVENDLKIRTYFRPWGLKGEELPPPYKELSRNLDDAQLPGYEKTVDELVLLAHPEYPYASIQTAEGVMPCSAAAMGGHIDVTCDSPAAGELTVLERAAPGWTVLMDGQKLPLHNANWLTIAAPAGSHEFSFRYRPWDVPLGFAFSLAGWTAAGWELVKSGKAKKNISTLPEPE